jgi:hypothetical protein
VVFCVRSIDASNGKQSIRRVGVRRQVTSPDHADWTRTTCPQHYMTDERCGSWCEPARVAFIQAAEALDSYWRDYAVNLEYERRYGARVA